MAKQVIFLDAPQLAGGVQQVRACFWFPVAAGQEVAQPTFVSAWKDIAAQDPTALLALQNGQLVEVVVSHEFPTNMTLAQMETFLKALYDSKANYLAAQPGPGKFYGVFLDSLAGWSK